MKTLSTLLRRSLPVLVLGGLAVIAMACQQAPARSEKSTAAADTVAVFHVEGVDCAACTLAIRKALRRVDGVEKVEADVDRQNVRVTYVREKVTPETIARTINAIGGFKATLLRTEALSRQAAGSIG